MKKLGLLTFGLFCIPSVVGAATVIFDETPILSSFGLDDATGTANNQTSDYFGVGSLDPVGGTRWAIVSSNGHTTRLNTNSAFGATVPPPAPISNGTVVFGRDINAIDDNSDGTNEDYAGETITWSLPVPVGVAATNLLFSLEGGLSDDDFEGTDDLDFELFINGVSAATTTLESTALDAATGDSSFSLFDPALFTDPLGTSGISNVSVVATVGRFNGAAEGFWLSGNLSVMVPEPSRAVLLGLGLVPIILRRRR